MFGLGPQKFLSQAANNKPPETNEVPNATRPKPSKQTDTSSDMNKLNNQGTNKDLENSKQANINDAKVSKNEIAANDKMGDSNDPNKAGYFAQMKEKIKNSIKKKAMAGMASTMEGKPGNSGDEGNSPIGNQNAPAENRPGQQNLPQPDKTRPKPRVPGTEVGVTNPGSMETPVTGGVEIPQTKIPASNFNMPKPTQVMPRMPKFGR